MIHSAVRVAASSDLVVGCRRLRRGPGSAAVLTSLPYRRARAVPAGTVVVTVGGRAGRRLDGGVVQRVVTGVQQTGTASPSVTGQGGLRAELLVH